MKHAEKLAPAGALAAALVLISCCVPFGITAAFGLVPYAPDTTRVGGAVTESRPGVERVAKTTIETAGATVDCIGDTVYADHRPATERIFAEHGGANGSGQRWK